MGVLSPTAGSNPLQTLVDQQANAIHLLHSAFTAERKVWGLERESMMLRIASLEQLLKTGDHHRYGQWAWWSECTLTRL